MAPCQVPLGILSPFHFSWKNDLEKHQAHYSWWKISFGKSWCFFPTNWNYDVKNIGKNNSIDSLLIPPIFHGFSCLFNKKILWRTIDDNSFLNIMYEIIVYWFVDSCICVSTMLCRLYQHYAIHIQEPIGLHILIHAQIALSNC